jgi:hypothetical protein
MESDVHGVSVGKKAQQDRPRKRTETEAYWTARSWVLAGGKLKRDDRFLQLSWFKFRVTPDKVM